MKKLFLVVSLVALLVGCKTTSEKEVTVVATADNSRTSLDWNGIYSGTLPCADCAGIDFTISLCKDNTYSLSRTYMKNPEANFRTEGTFEWNEEGSKITLKDAEGNEEFKFKVGENRLLYLDLQGNEITGNLADKYILTKLDDAITNKYWKLTELMGTPVTINESSKEAYMTLKPNGKVNGNFGCNTFSGTYTLRMGNRITFSPMAATMMMCMSMETEAKFSEVLGIVDNFSINGDTLTLNKARMAPLARFEAVYMN